MNDTTEITTTEKAQPLTGGCCQWRDSASYDRNVHIEIVVLCGKFSGKIATASNRQTVMDKFKIKAGLRKPKG